MVFIIDGKDYGDIIPVCHDPVSIHGGSANLPTLEEWLQERLEKAGRIVPTVAELVEAG